MTTVAKTGSYSVAEFLELWKSVTDDNYTEPLIRQGEGAGLEVFTQQMAQMEAVSRDIDVTAEAMYITAWSGRTNDPAAGEAFALVELTIERSIRLEQTITLVAGTLIDEQQVDHGEAGGVEVSTGRRYALMVPLTFGPGERGPFAVLAASVKPGYGYNKPAPGTLKRIEQPGSNLQNDRATVQTGATLRLQVREQPDVVSPDNIGSYVEFTVGANTGQRRRAIGYQAADDSVPHGGILTFSRTVVLQVAAGAGSFVVGELVKQAAGAEGVFLYRSQSSAYIVLESANLTGFGNALLTGVTSGATATVTAVEQQADLTAEAETAGWRVLDWAIDFGIVVTNALSPAGGRLGMLDMLGEERRIGRAPNETDDLYRKRIHRLPDTVSPNAILRVGNRVLGQVGASVCLREVGSAQFPGLFLDGDPNSVDPAVAFAFDLDFTVRPQDRYKLLVDYEEMRAFFLVVVPPLSLGDFGAAYDVGAADAYDAAPFLCFYDGFPETAATLYRGVWQAVDGARADGVGFDLDVDPRGCA